MSTTIAVKKRKENGSRECKKLRKTGEIPAIIYGNKKENVSIAVSLETILPFLKNKEKSFKLTFEQQEEEVTVQEIQKDYLADTILHIDFCRVANQK